MFQNPFIYRCFTVISYQVRLKTLLFLIVCLLGSIEISIAQSNTKTSSLKISFENAKNDSLKVVYAIELSRELHRHSHNQEEEYAYAEEAVNLALELKDTLQYAITLDNLGLLNRYHEQYDEALSLHAKAFDLVEHKNVEPIHKMIFGNNAGVAARYNQNYDSAMSYYIKALKIAEEEDDLKNIAISNNGIGNTLVYVPGREEEALEYFEESLKAETQRNNTLGMAMNYLSISDFFIHQEDYSTARDYLNQLLKLNEKREDLFGLAITEEFYGISYLREEKDLDQAITYFETSLDKFKQLDIKHKQADLISSLGNAYFKKNQLTQAEAYFKQALKLAKDLNQFGLIESSSLSLSQLQENKGNYKTALDYFKTSKAYKDSIEIEEQNVKIEALKREYDLEKKENQIQFLEKDKLLQEALLDSKEEQLETRRLANVLLAIAFASILIIFLLQYRNHKSRKKANAKLMQEEKEKTKAIYERNLAQAEILVTRLRVNPHFLFNSLNAITYLIQSEQNLTAIKYLKIFSRYTRMVLETSKEQVIPLQEELKLAKYYLLLEENRFERDFSFKIIGEDLPEIEKVCIPPLLIQPFLENAIWHGLLLSPKTDKCLSISVKIKNNTTYLVIDDNGIGRNLKKKDKAHHKSMGMEIIAERIDLFNKTQSNTQLSFRIIDKKDINDSPLGTQVVIKLKNLFS